MTNQCPRCGSSEGFIIKDKIGYQQNLLGANHEDVYKKKAVPVCASCGKWSDKDTIKNNFKGVKSMSHLSIDDIVERGGIVTLERGHPVVSRPLQMGNNNNTRCPECGMENSVMEVNGRETCLKCGNDVTGRLEVITWVR